MLCIFPFKQPRYAPTLAMHHRNPFLFVRNPLWRSYCRGAVRTKIRLPADLHSQAQTANWDSINRPHFKMHHDWNATTKQFIHTKKQLYGLFSTPLAYYEYRVSLIRTVRNADTLSLAVCSKAPSCQQLNKSCNPYFCTSLDPTCSRAAPPSNQMPIARVDLLCVTQSCWIVPRRPRTARHDEPSQAGECQANSASYTRL